MLSALYMLTSPIPKALEGDPTVTLLISQMSKRRHSGFTTLPKATRTVSGRYGIQSQAAWPLMDAFGYSASNHPLWDTKSSRALKKKLQNAQISPNHSKGFHYNFRKRKVELYIVLHYTGNLHKTFNLWLNLILQEGYKSYHYNVSSYVAYS